MDLIAEIRRRHLASKESVSAISRDLNLSSRRVLAWKLSIMLQVEFCIEAVEEALARYGRPEIFNTDQGSQFTSDAFTGLLKGSPDTSMLPLRPTRLR